LIGGKKKEKVRVSVTLQPFEMAEEFKIDNNPMQGDFQSLIDTGRASNVSRGSNRLSEVNGPGEEFNRRPSIKESKSCTVLLARVFMSPYLSDTEV